MVVLSTIALSKLNTSLYSESVYQPTKVYPVLLSDSSVIVKVSPKLTVSVANTSVAEVFV